MVLFILIYYNLQRSFLSLEMIKAYGPDGTPPYPEGVGLPACACACLFCLCLNTSIFSSPWKHALVQPIPGKWNWSNPSNYRHIVLTSIKLSFWISSLSFWISQFSLCCLAWWHSYSTNSHLVFLAQWLCGIFCCVPLILRKLLIGPDIILWFSAFHHLAFPCCSVSLFPAFSLIRSFL